VLVHVPRVLGLRESHLDPHTLTLKSNSSNGFGVSHSHTLTVLAKVPGVLGLREPHLDARARPRPPPNQRPGYEPHLIK